MSNFRCINPFFGSTHFQWSSMGRDLCLWKVSVAADYSDSVPDSSNYTSHQGYHPLEEVKISKRVRETQLTSAEIARTTVEVCALIVLWIGGTKMSMLLLFLLFHAMIRPQPKKSCVCLLFCLRLTPVLCWSFLGLYIVNHMNKFHGQNFNMLLTTMEVYSSFNSAFVFAYCLDL